MTTKKPTVDLELLRNCSLFNRLDDPQLQTLAERLKPLNYKRNDIIFLKHDPGDALYLIQAGRVKISVLNSEGKDLTINIYGPGEVFGEMSLFDGLPRSAAASALEPTNLLQLNRPAFEKLLNEVPVLAGNIIALLSRRLRYTTEQTEMIGLMGAYERVAQKLLQLVEAAGPADPVTITISQQDLASMLGLTREWINKILQLFVDNQVVELQRGRLIVLDRHNLKQWV